MRRLPSSRPPSRRLACILRPVAVGVAALLLVTGCSSAGDDDSAEVSVDASGFPLTIENCGHTLTFDQPATRIFSNNQEMTETLLSLDLQKQIVATGSWNEKVHPSLAEKNEGIESLERGGVSKEAVLALEPDLIAASWSPYNEGSLGDRAQFDELGIQTYISPTECVGKADTGDSDESERTGLIDVNVFYEEIEDLAKIAGQPSRGPKLVADLKKQVEEARKFDFSGTTAAFWYADEEAPYLAGCCGASGFIAETLNLKNTFDDTRKDWPHVSWEAVAAKNPDVLVIPDLDRDGMKSGDSGADKIKFLESHPVTKHMKAVENKRYVLVRATALTPSIEMITELQAIAEKIASFGYGKK
ncbi:MAG: ABC transporter substrate-binding protein [Gordonia sp. (in: high G+C Gram-positive bacteria)]|uniref:ABC transporter substrate-binding protein n=1 Tax=Gordonia sp. (in: high G+C Gram-positive bacteria) TaxID=84139 RepID=UPI0039E4D92D